MSVEYWVWLQQVLGFGSDAVGRVISNYKTAKEFHAAPDKEKIERCRLTKAQADRLHGISRRKIANIISRCAAENINIITPESPLYPERLLSIPNPPAVLYHKGKPINIEKRLSVTIVGPRKPSDYGKAAAYTISKTLSSCNILIVSGGALGIDSAAHRGAIDAQGDTVAVLGCGIASDYLKANKQLRSRIENNGCLISEYPPDVSASRGSFPQRNRIMSGLSMGTVLIEAPLGSGGLITAGLANEQGRDVFVIPGNPSSKDYEGSNKVLKDGAKPLIDINDIIEEYIDVYRDRIKLPEVLKTELVGEAEIVTEKIEEKEIKPTEALDTSVLSEEAKSLLWALDSEFSVESVVAKCNVSPSDVMSLLTELEIYGFIKSLHGGNYQKIS